MLENDQATEEMRVSLDVKTLKQPHAAGTSSQNGTNAASQNLEVSEESHTVFWVGSFEFAMIDNTRLSSDQRCAVVLRGYETTSAQLTVVCFPGSRAALKEKPYYDDVLNKLRADSAHPW